MVVVTGVTGLQGGAVARHLLSSGWRVRGLTRNRAGKRAQAMAALGVDVMQGDMADAHSLQSIFAGAYGVYSVQNPYISGAEGEVHQGKTVAEVAQTSGVQHFVYGSAGTGARGTGVPSWETKLRIEDHMRTLGLPLTILRPMAYMELMTEKKFFPAVGTWQIMRALTGDARSLPWLCTDDLGLIVARVFDEPGRFLGADIRLASDVQTLEQCHALYRDVLGRNPPRFPMPLALFKRFGFAGQDLPTMWRWLRSGDLPLDTSATRAIHPAALTVREWLGKQQGRQ